MQLFTKRIAHSTKQLRLQMRWSKMQNVWVGVCIAHRRAPKAQNDKVTDFKTYYLVLYTAEKKMKEKKSQQNQQNNPTNDYVERTILDFNIERNCICNGASAAAGWLMNEIIRQMRPFFAPLFLVRLRFKWMNTIIVLFFVDFFPSFIFKLLLSSVQFIISPFIRRTPEYSFYF